MPPTPRWQLAARLQRFVGQRPLFTGIVQGVAQVARLTDWPGLRSVELAFPEGFGACVEIGAGVACDGVCLTVTTSPGPGHRSSTL